MVVIFHAQCRSRLGQTKIPCHKTWDEIRGTTQITYKYTKYMSLENLTHLYVISYWKFSEIKLMDDFQRIQSCNLTPNDYISLRPTAPTVPITAFLYIYFCIMIY